MFHKLDRINIKWLYVPGRIYTARSKEYLLRLMSLTYKEKEHVN